MYNVTTAIRNAIRADARAWRSRLALTSGGYIYGVEDINFTNGSQSGQNITVGSVIAPTIKITLTDTILSTTSQPIELTGREFVWQLGVFPDINSFTGNEPNNAYTYIPIGKFTVDKVKQNGTRYEAECSHKLSKADVVHKTALSFPASALNLMQEVVNSLSMTLSLTNAQTNVLRTYPIEGIPDGATKRDIMGWIAILLGGFVCADRSGNVIVKWYESSGYVAPVNAISEPEIAEQQITYTAVVCTVDNETTYTEGTGTAMTFTCPFMLEVRFSEIAQSLKNFSYRPCKLTYLLGDPLIDPWDIVGFGASYTMPAATMALEHKGGVTGTIEAKTAKNESRAEHVDPISKAVDRLVNMISEGKSEVEQDIADAIAEVTDTIRGGSSGYFYIIPDANGINKETIWCDNIDPQNATHGIRINSAGIGFWSASAGGNIFDGPYTNAWSIDGVLVADFIKAGTLTGITIVCTQGNIGGWDITDHAIISPDEQVKLESTYDAPIMTNTKLRDLLYRHRDLRNLTHNQIRAIQTQPAGTAQVAASKDADTCALRNGEIVLERAGKMQLEISAETIRSGANGSYITQSPEELISDLGDINHILVTCNMPTFNVPELVAEWRKNEPGAGWYVRDLYVLGDVHSQRIDTVAVYASGLVRAEYIQVAGMINSTGRFDAYTVDDPIKNHGGVNYYDDTGDYMAGTRPAQIDNEYGIAMSFPESGYTDFIGLWGEQNSSTVEKYNNLIAGYFRTDDVIKIRKPTWIRSDLLITSSSDIPGITLNNRYIDFTFPSSSGSDVGCIAQLSDAIDTRLINGSRIRWGIGTRSSMSNTIFEYTKSDDTLHIRRDTNMHNYSLLNAVISSSSDERLKDHISPCDKDCLSVINALKLIEFDWKDGSGHEDIGFSAQQAGRVSPDLRGEDADGYSTVHEGRLIRYLVGAVQQLTKEVEELKHGTKFSNDERK